MPQATNLTLKDGTATPVDRTFEVLSSAAGYGGVAEFVYKKGNYPSGWPTLTVMATRAKTKRKVTGKLVYPVVFVDASTGISTTQSIAIGHFDVQFDADFPEDQKDHVIAFMANGIANATVKSALRDGAPLV